MLQYKIVYMRETFYKLALSLDTRTGQLRLTGILFLFVFATTFPKYIELLNDPSPKTTYSYFFNKIEHPLSPATSTEISSHGSKIAFRFTAPLIAKVSGAQSLRNGKGVIIVYIIQSLLLLPFFFCLIKLLQRFADNVTSLFFTLSLAAVYTSKAFFWDYDFWFDGYAYFFLLLGLYFKNRYGIFLSLQAASWTDERAVIALSSVYLFHLLAENNFELLPGRQIFRTGLKGRSSIVLLSALFYLVVRALLSGIFHLNTPHGGSTGVGLELLPFQLRHRLIGIFLSFEGLWFIFISALYLLFQSGKFLYACLLIAIMAIHILVAYSVFDITRSLSYSFPLFIICALIFARHRSGSNDLIFSLSALTCLLIPTQFLIFFVRHIPFTIFSLQEIKVVAKSLIYNF
jgi:hypothetical protein